MMEAAPPEVALLAPRSQWAKQLVAAYGVPPGDCRHEPSDTHREAARAKKRGRRKGDCDYASHDATAAGAAGAAANHGCQARGFKSPRPHAADAAAMSAPSTHEMCSQRIAGRPAGATPGHLSCGVLEPKKGMMENQLGEVWNRSQSEAAVGAPDLTAHAAAADPATTDAAPGLTALAAATAAVSNPAATADATAAAAGGSFSARPSWPAYFRAKEPQGMQIFPDPPLERFTESSSSSRSSSPANFNFTPDTVMAEPAEADASSRPSDGSTTCPREGTTFSMRSIPDLNLPAHEASELIHGQQVQATLGVGDVGLEPSGFDHGVHRDEIPSPCLSIVQCTSPRQQQHKHQRQQQHQHQLQQQVQEQVHTFAPSAGLQDSKCPEAGRRKQLIKEIKSQMYIFWNCCH
ncbi:hypothetical protein CLOM_g4701 [Closterium sp. NIES-68]|nr:hypothetical protein CLOM_g24326 [Closterium sp. NIES-68]GJP45297.1 hypothetical protein CLOM_g4701 [Closterium sp. NIES-68]GJP57978.1 hypothetical protein CLOP_g19894 [Closterium sp. NIES-67]GJP66062.1 hypothetical protein CLOP_g22965 [Closterium sp. NIES-67]